MRAALPLACLLLAGCFSATEDGSTSTGTTVAGTGGGRFDDGGARTLQGACEAWRDFMPGPEPRDQGLRLLVRVDKDANAAPDGLRLGTAHVRQGEAAWDPVLEDQGDGSWMARGGPAWEVGSQVDVSADATWTGGSGTLRCEDVPITATH